MAQPLFHAQPTGGLAYQSDTCHFDPEPHRETEILLHPVPAWRSQVAHGDSQSAYLCRPHPGEIGRIIDGWANRDRGVPATQYRRYVKERIAESSDVLFNDLEVIAERERFVEEALENQ